MTLADRLHEPEGVEFVDDLADGRAGEVRCAGKIRLGRLAEAAQPAQDQTLIVLPDLQGIRPLPGPHGTHGPS